MSSDVVVPSSEDEGSGKLTVAKVLLGVGGVIAIPFILSAVWFLLLATAGLIGIGILAAIGLLLWKALPYFGQVWDNKLLNLRLAEARKNPIVQMKSNMIFKAKQLNAFKANLLKIKTQIDGLVDSLKAQKQRDPGIDLTREAAGVEKMTDWYNKKKQSYGAALQAYQQYEQSVDRATFKYGFGTAAAGVSKVMNDQDADKIMQDMLSDEAFRSVNDTFNSAFAQLDLDSIELSDSKELEFGAGQVLDVQAIQIPSSTSPTLPVSVATPVTAKV